MVYIFFNIALKKELENHINNSSLTENLVFLYINENNVNEDSINNSLDSYEKIFGITIQKEPINGIKLSSILSEFENSFDSCVDLPLPVESKNVNYENIEAIDNFYEDQFDKEIKIINLKMLQE